jgi:hypothetical protein
MVFMFGCYGAPVNTSTWNSTAPRVIARIFANGSYDTSVYCTDCLPSPMVFTTVRARCHIPLATAVIKKYYTCLQVVSNDGISGWFIGGGEIETNVAASPSPTNPPSGPGGIWWVPASASYPVATTLLYQVFNIKALMIYNNWLWASKNYLPVTIAGDGGINGVFR